MLSKLFLEDFQPLFFAVRHGLFMTLASLTRKL